MIKPQYRDAYENPVWLLWECEHGRRWSTVKGSPDSNRSYDGQPCDFSGCPPGHTARIIDSTPDRSKAHDWFRPW